MATNTDKATVLLIVLVAILPLSTVGSRAGPSTHHSHGGSNKHPSPPPPPPPSPSPPPPAPPASTLVAPLVRSTCNATTYYDLCVSTLGADPSSATADVRGLSAIAVSVAAANASGGAATATALATASANNNATAKTAADATVQALLRTCAAKYGQARDALGGARDSIAQQSYDYASVQVGAAAEYPQVCRVLFQRQRPGAYPPELAAREVALRQLCTVALDIITLLSDSS